MSDDICNAARAITFVISFNKRKGQLSAFFFLLFHSLFINLAHLEDGLGLPIDVTMIAQNLIEDFRFNASIIKCGMRLDELRHTLNVTVSNLRCQMGRLILAKLFVLNCPLLEVATLEERLSSSVHNATPLYFIVIGEDSGESVGETLRSLVKTLPVEDSIVSVEILTLESAIEDVADLRKAKNLNLTVGDLLIIILVKLIQLVIAVVNLADDVFMSVDDDTILNVHPAELPNKAVGIGLGVEDAANGALHFGSLRWASLT